MFFVLLEQKAKHFVLKYFDSSHIRNWKKDKKQKAKLLVISRELLAINPWDGASS